MASPYRLVLLGASKSNPKMIQAIISIAKSYRGTNSVLKLAAGLNTPEMVIRHLSLGSKFVIALKQGEPVGFMEFDVVEPARNSLPEVQIFRNLSVPGESFDAVNLWMRKGVMQWAQRENILVVHDTLDTDAERRAFEKHEKTFEKGLSPGKGKPPLVTRVERDARGNVRFILNNPPVGGVRPQKVRRRPPAK